MLLITFNKAEEKILKQVIIVIHLFDNNSGLR